MVNDLREFIGKSEEVGEVKRVNGADWKHEIGLITELNPLRLCCPNQVIIRTTFV